MTGHPADVTRRLLLTLTVLSGDGRISTRTAESGGVDIMSVAVPIHPGVATLGAIRVSVPTGPMESRIHRFWLILAAAGIAVLLTAGLVACWLARWISKPVRALEHATRRHAAGHCHDDGAAGNAQEKLGWVLRNVAVSTPL